MTTGAKVGIGLGVALLAGVGIYFAFFHEAEKVVADTKKPDEEAAAMDKPKKGKSIGEMMKEGKCNMATPPPRIKPEKIAAYDKCMQSAAGNWN